MKKLILVITILGLVNVGGSESAGKRMNVLFLVADDGNRWLLEDDDRYPGKIVARNLCKLARSEFNFTLACTDPEEIEVVGKSP